MIPPLSKFNNDDERCTDVLDIAGKTTEMLRGEAERRARALSAPERDARFDGISCVEEGCGITMPAERLALGRIRCIDCQVELETRNKQRRS